MSTGTPLIYRSTGLYALVMRILHGRDYEGRYSALAAEVPEGCSITEICAGDARLYLHYLRERNPVFIGLDNSPAFVAAGQARGLDFREFDLKEDPVPPGDVVIIQASLHIFIREIDSVMEKLLRSAGQKLIIAEPIRNLSSSPNPLVAWLGRTLTRPRGGDHYTGFRFDEATFREHCSQFPELEKLTLCPGGREMIAVFRGRGHCP